MIKVILLGAGNLAVHLAKAFGNSKNIEFKQRYSRSSDNDSYFDVKIVKTNRLSNIEKADIYVIAINDDQISSFSDQLLIDDGLVVHTSGSMSMQILKCKANKGVLYPLQTFSRDQKTNFRNIPIAFETENKRDFNLLATFAKSLSDYTYPISSQKRKYLHIAAVFANNFTNHMYKIANDICDEHNFSFDLLKPLIQETADKMLTLSPGKSQTGPAKRNDKKVIDNHLLQLDKNQKEIYTLVTKSIINTYHKNRGS